MGVRSACVCRCVLCLLLVFIQSSIHSWQKNGVEVKRKKKLYMNSFRVRKEDESVARFAHTPQSGYAWETSSTAEQSSVRLLFWWLYLLFNIVCSLAWRNYQKWTQIKLCASQCSIDCCMKWRAYKTHILCIFLTSSNAGANVWISSTPIFVTSHLCCCFLYSDAGEKWFLIDQQFIYKCDSVIPSTHIMAWRHQMSFVIDMTICFFVPFDLCSMFMNEILCGWDQYFAGRPPKMASQHIAWCGRCTDRQTGGWL